MTLKNAIDILEEYHSWLRFENVKKQNLDNVNEALSVVLPKLKKQSVIDKLTEHSIKDTVWLKDSQYRQKNEWWIRYWFRIQTKYYIIRRIIKNKFG